MRFAERRHPFARRLAAAIEALWRTSPPLVAMAALMSVAAVLMLAALVLDPRVIAGQPAWVKPLKFAFATGAYGLTLAWMFMHLDRWPRLRGGVGWTTAVVFVLEVAIISLQAWRGTTSHFNVATPLDSALFMVMGAAILLQTIVSIAVLVALVREPLQDRPVAWAFRTGMALTIAGALIGPLMTRPTGEQIASARLSGHRTTAGQHSVGGVDGGPGMAVTGWNSKHGDMRVPHFIGLHAMQVLPLIAVGLRRWRRTDAVRGQLVLAAAASYAGLFALLTWQALRGQSLVAPDETMAVCLLAWAALTALALGWIDARGRARGADRRVRMVPA